MTPEDIQRWEQELVVLRDLYSAYLYFRDELMRQHMSLAVERLYSAGEKARRFYGETNETR